MLEKLLIKRNHRRSAQALVEFTLTALVFLFLIVMIIEVARILQAFVTIQHAAREAARYAVTGQFDPKYGNDPTAGWQENRLTADPLRSIRPCWPLFDADTTYPNSIPRTAFGTTDARLYQPYRGPRTCSTEEAAVRNMAGLILNPNARSFDPDYYEIVVSGTAKDIDPTEGTFVRHPGSPPETLNYADYYSPTGTVMDYDLVPPALRSLSEVKQGTSRGYAGDPGKKVQVQIEYNIRLITPLLSNIAPYVRLNATAVMTVETFGAMSLQRESVPPPPDPKPQPMTSTMTPPDLVVRTISCPFTSRSTGQSMDCSVTIENIGGSAVTATPFTLRVFRAPEPRLDPPFAVPFNPAGAAVIDVPITDDIPAAWPLAIIVPVNFPDPGMYYLYAWVDGGAGDDNAVIERIAPFGDGYFDDMLLVTNNVAVMPSPISVLAIADLEVQKTVDEANPPENGAIQYTITVTNHGPDPAPGVVVTDMLDGRLTNVTFSSTVGTYDSGTGIWIVGNLGDGDSATLYINANVDADHTAIVNQAAVSAGPGVSEPSPPDPNLPNSASVTVTPGSIEMALTKVVINPPPPAQVDYGTSPTVTYKITVTNNSTTTDATNVVVQDTLPAELQSVSASTTMGTCSVGAVNPDGTTPLQCSVDSPGSPLAPGASADITVTAVVKPTVVAGTVISNQATVTANELTGSLASSPPATVTVRGADIEVVKEASVGSANETVQFTYTIRAYNRGPSDAQNVRISDVLPATVQYVSHSADTGTSYDQVTGVWNIGNLSSVFPANSKQLTIVVFPKTGTLGTTIRNTASLLPGSTPPQPSSGGYPDSDYADVLVTGDQADLVLTKQVNPVGPVYPGATVTYMLTLHNNGPLNVTGRAVEDMTLRDALLPSPPYGPLFDFVSAAASKGTVPLNPSTGDWTGQWTGIDLNVGETVTATITVKALGRKDTDYVFDNMARIVPGPMIDPGVNTATASIRINWPDPIFINAGGNNCTEDIWGVSDPTLNNRNFTWTVNGGANNWTLSGGIERSRLDINRYLYVDSAHAELSLPGKNLFACRTSTSGLYSAFTYRFGQASNPLVPGAWKLYLAFMEWDTDADNYRLVNVRYNGTGTNQNLLTDFDIVSGMRTAGIGANRHYVSGSGNNTVYQVHYLILPFDVTVNGQAYLDVRFYQPGGWGGLAQVSGLGIEYVGP